jgi:hypothetical protein
MKPGRADARSAAFVSRVAAIALLGLVLVLASSPAMARALCCPVAADQGHCPPENAAMCHGVCGACQAALPVLRAAIGHPVERDVVPAPLFTDQTHQTVLRPSVPPPRDGRTMNLAP